MRILYTGQSLTNPLGGGETSSLSLLKGLSKKHEIFVVGLNAKEDAIFSKGGINFYNFRSPRIAQNKLIPFHLRALITEYFASYLILKFVNKFLPDLVILQNPAYVSNRRSKENIRFVVFIHSLNCYGLADNQANRIKKIYNFPFLRFRQWKNKKFLKKVDLVISNSHFMKAELLKLQKTESEVMYPVVGSERVETTGRGREEGKYIGFVNLVPEKGGWVVLQLAKALPKEQFLVILGRHADSALREKANLLRNVNLIPWVDDMRAFYKKIKFLIMPSIWNEPFGMLPVEAGLNGIPTIASKCGGLFEAINGGGIFVEDPTNINEWISCIEKLSNYNFRLRLGSEMRQHASKFRVERGVDKFLKIMRKIGIRCDFPRK